MSDLTPEELVRAVHEAAVAGGTPVCGVPDIPDGQPLAEEWQTFRRELSRLIANGHKGRFALVKGGRVDSVWDTQRDALQAGQERFPGETFLVQEVQWFLRRLRRGYSLVGL